MAKRWLSERPERCQLCKVTFKTHEKDAKTAFVDGKTKMGPWGIMCESCHQSHGVGLGEGKGQKYRISNGMPMMEGVQ